MGARNYTVRDANAAAVVVVTTRLLPLQLLLLLLFIIIIIGISIAVTVTGSAFRVCFIKIINVNCRNRKHYSFILASFLAMFV